MKQVEMSVAQTSKPTLKKVVVNSKKKTVKKQVRPKANDGYRQVSMEFDSDYRKEEKANGYLDVDEANRYNLLEDKDISTPLDGEALTREIGGTVLTKELYDKDMGAGFKDRRDL